MASLTSAAHAQKLQFEATWWTNASAGEKTGFVLGFEDCPAATEWVHGLTSNDYLAFVNARLKANAISTPDEVARILRSAPHFLKPRPGPEGGEQYPEKHGWLDGAWWGDATHGDADEKLGYVEGYLRCRFGSATQHATSRSVRLLNAHYANLSNEHDKVANVLQHALEHRRDAR